MWLQARRFATVLARHCAVMDAHDPERQVGLAVDEWGCWYAPEPAASAARGVPHEAAPAAAAASGVEGGGGGMRTGRAMAGLAGEEIGAGGRTGSDSVFLIGRPGRRGRLA